MRFEVVRRHCLVASRDFAYGAGMRRRPRKHREQQLMVGLMSGTSADGIDAVVAEIRESGGKIQARLATHCHLSYPKQLRAELLRASAEGRVADICELNFVIGRWFGQAALGVIRKAKLSPRDIAAIGSHGQTIHHLPNETTPSTFQIGEPAVIAELTGITTVADFRVGDMAAGGQGAPLVSFADWALFTEPGRPRIIQNIGGIANLTFLPAGAKLNEVIAFDTGPGNMVIDGIVAKLSKNRQSYDKNGAWAGKGKFSQRLLSELMNHSFLKKQPPKTTGREEFGEAFIARLLTQARQLRLTDADIVATATAFTAASIADAYQRFVLPRIRPAHVAKLQVILGGGGTMNVTLRRMLADKVQSILPDSDDANERTDRDYPYGTPSAALRVSKASPVSLANNRLLTHEDFGIPNLAKEALGFAILAHETLAGRPSNIPAATGARHPVVLGKIISGGSLAATSGFRRW